MHPEIARSIAAQHRADLHQMAARHRLARQARARRGSAARPRDRAPSAPGSGVFLDRPEAFGFRSYLTAAEARQLTRDWADLLGRFADRVDDETRRPDGAEPFEVVVLSHQVPDLAHTGQDG